MRDESLLAQRGSIQLTFLLRQSPKRKFPFRHGLKKPSHWMSLLSTSCASLCPSSWFPFTLYGLFLCSLPVKWLLALPLGLWSTLFHLVCKKQKALGLKVWATPQLQTGLSSIQSQGPQCEQISCNSIRECFLFSISMSYVTCILTPCVMMPKCLYWQWQCSE